MKLFTIILFTAITTFASALDIAMSYEPYAKYNSSKSHYFITVPKNPHSTKGYTAVLDAKTKTVLFKFDKYLESSYTFLSNDGKTLYTLSSEANPAQNNISWFIQTYTPEGNSQLVFRKKKQPFSADGGYMYVSPVVKFNENSFAIAWYDSTFNVQLSNSFISASETNPEQLTEWEAERMIDQLEMDSVFHYSQIETATGNLKERLISDLNLNETDFRSEAGKYIYFVLTLNAKGEINFFHVYAAVKENSDWMNDGLNFDFREKVELQLKSYQFLETNVPKGLDFYYFTGKIYSKN